MKFAVFAFIAIVLASGCISGGPICGNGVCEIGEKESCTIDCGEIPAEYDCGNYSDGSSRIRGDIDADGVVTEADKNIVMKMFTDEIPIPENKCCIDLKADGTINLTDSMLIGRIVEETFNMGTCANPKEYFPIRICEENVLKNHGFEEGFEGWETYGNVLFVNDPEKGKIATLEFNPDEQIFTSINQIIPAKKGAHIISGSVASESENSEFAVDLYALGLSEEMQPEPCILQAESSWQRFSCTIDVNNLSSENPLLGFRALQAENWNSLNSEKDSVLKIDDLCIEYKGTCGDNVCDNGEISYCQHDCPLECHALFPNTEAEGKFNIVFLPVGYSTTQDAENSVKWLLEGKQIYSQYKTKAFLDFYPINKYKDKFNFWFVTPLSNSEFESINSGCTQNMFFDACKQLEEETGTKNYNFLLYERENIIARNRRSSNACLFGSWGRLGAVIDIPEMGPSRTSSVTEQEIKDVMAANIHEMSHTLFLIYDEYVSRRANSPQEDIDFFTALGQRTPRDFKQTFFNEFKEGIATRNDCLENSLWKDHIGNGCGEDGVIDCFSDSENQASGD
jgi:hypothetical protein